GGELPLHFAGHREVDRAALAGRAMTQDRSRLPGVVIAVVVEKHDASAYLPLQPPRGLDLGDEKAARKEPAGLLPECDDRLRGHAAGRATATRGPRTARRARPQAADAPQPVG